LQEELIKVLYSFASIPIDNGLIVRHKEDTILITDKAREEKITGTDLKAWVMVTLTLLFVSLYTSALMGWLRPLADVTMITRLEPIIFVITGYYFGRLPGQANEKTLREEVARQRTRTDAAQHAKENAEKEREVIEEKIKNAKIALIPLRGETFFNGSTSSGGDERAAKKAEVDGESSQSIQTVFSILDS
jgi:hypothetical protein